LEEELKKAKLERGEALEIAQKLEKDTSKLEKNLKSKNDEIQTLNENIEEIKKKQKQELDNVKLQYEQEIFILKRIGKA